MATASLAFLAFAAVVALAYNLAQPVWWRQGVLLVANAAFLASFLPSAVSVLPLLGFLAVGYACLRLAQRSWFRGGTYVVVLALILVLFFWLKRYSFLPPASFLPFAYSVIGLSYIFFRVMHIVIDAHDESLEEPVSPIAYLNYVLNFTSLVSGPIQQYQDYAAQQLRPERLPFGWRLAGKAVEQIAIGLFKAVVLAGILHAVHARGLAAFAAAPDLPARILGALTITVGYTVYLYCNFSGYTDIVIGAARFYRLELPENFNRPFSATSFVDFWARWHMTLSGWLKTYVYNPLVMALMARFPSPAAAPFLGVVAFFVTFFLIGLWHGQTSVFAIYGVLLGFGVSVNKLYQVEMARRLGRKRYRALTEQLWYQAVGRGLTFMWFTVSLVFFWGSWPVIGEIASGLGWGGAILAAAVLVVVAGATLTLGVMLRDWSLGVSAFGTPVLLSRYTRTVWVTAMSAVAGAALTLLASPAPDVVYKTF
jgi:D-alanyl-lipoteichoic acid acyltransferase DltB (MBOAT superfamily)